MIYNTIFTSDQINKALSGGILNSGLIPTNNAVSWNLINNSPYYLDIFDQNDNVIAEVAPWSNTQDNFDHNVTSIEIKANTSLPVVNFQGNSNFDVKLGLTSVSLYPQSSNTIQVSNVNSQTANVSILGTPNVNIANTPSVNATITGTANVNIANTPSVSIASGNVNATIQNASINSKVVNQLLAQNNMVLIGSGTISVSNLANQSYLAINTDQLNYNAINGAYFVNNIGAYDGLLVVTLSNNGINWSANGFPINPTGLYSHYLSVELQNPLNSTIATTSRIAKIVRQIQMPNGGTNALLLWYNETYTFNVATVAIQNLSGSTISSDTLVVYYFGIKSIQESDRGGIYTTASEIYTLPNQTYVTIYSNGNYNTLLKKVIIGTSLATTNAFYFTMGTSSSSSNTFLYINTTTTSQVYDFGPGIIIPPGYTIFAYQSSGGTVSAEITLVVM